VLRKLQLARFVSIPIRAYSHPPPIQAIPLLIAIFIYQQDVVYALAHATAQTGRFTLIERWRTNERLLAPYENPLKVILIPILNLKYF
jgi:hypothetical protein